MYLNYTNLVARRVLDERSCVVDDLPAICPQKTGSTNINAQTAEIQRHRNCGGKCLIFGGNRNKDCKIAQATIAVSYVCLSPDVKVFQGAVAYGKAGLILEKVTDTATVEEARRWVSLYITAFDYPVEATKANHLARLINRIKAMHPFVNLAITVNESLGEFHRKDFFDANSAFAQSIIQEAIDRESTRESGAKLTVDAYMAARKDSIGLKSGLALSRSAVGLNIDSKLLDEPSVKGMEDATVDLTIITNDIYSYKKELADDNDAHHNLLTVLMQQDPRLDLQGVIDCAGQLFESALARFKECRASIPSIDEETDKMLATYAQWMVDIFVGGVEWSLVTPRYRVFDSEENRRKGLMAL
ncbi:isoprenoid synthase domain-containing protein [Hygrophoropsis aurantiaca]|uniref:Isoprenoid synthase domain-containing protein n=1 Tax=Hygrophoropsis aurantiaca TaxID=72124 RepID=A0ACB7ZZZ5_9AGAM|nr:isoprenoid synthase domain-containing protein [Hygrophoropsis aurantiaca]